MRYLILCPALLELDAVFSDEHTHEQRSYSNI